MTQGRTMNSYHHRHPLLVEMKYNSFRTYTEMMDDNMSVKTAPIMVSSSKSSSSSHARRKIVPSTSSSSSSVQQQQQRSSRPNTRISSSGSSSTAVRGAACSRNNSNNKCYAYAKRKLVRNTTNGYSSDDSVCSNTSTTTSSSCDDDNYTVITENVSGRRSSSKDTRDKAPLHDLASLINYERSKYPNLHPLERSSQLDYLANEHCRTMAQNECIYQSVNTISELQQKLSSLKVGENILRGTSIVQMHTNTMMSPHQNANRSNILSKHFTEFGSAIHIGNDGKIYCCQLFRQVSY